MAFQRFTWKAADPTSPPISFGTAATPAPKKALSSSGTSSTITPPNPSFSFGTAATPAPKKALSSSGASSAVTPPIPSFSFGTAATPAPKKALSSSGASSAITPNPSFSFGTAPLLRQRSNFHWERPGPSPPFSYGTASTSPSPRQRSEKNRFVTRPNRSQRPPRRPLQVSPPTRWNKSSEKLNQATSLDKRCINKPTDGRCSAIDDSTSSEAVAGYCPGMCPESERRERKRKGYLDRYERLDGDINHTSKYLAVKKCNRTVKCEPDLVRPMLVLQNTIDYLLSLLNRPYNKEFLDVYNFLWDRMREIRMDLKMQCISNHQAIVMLEQMIRLHIVAMHELCEYNKAEDFSTGFDAYLNIEQTNKASLELFKMYEDHRKKGMSVPTEKEFRGYYALLNLDEHPGHKVEPTQLSLDLAQLTPELRSSTEILFARNVARACRMGNYIAFFRLAKKATYLQACLMHAHFAKLRRKALTSLHGSLRNSQGIPITDVINWLGLEEEDVKGFLQYHGFGLKKFEETYMVKEGPFLNSDTDFPTKCSHLVQLKRSHRILDDISYSGPTISEVALKRETVSVGEMEIPVETSNLVQLKKSERAIHDIFSDANIPNFTEKREANVEAAEVSIPSDTDVEIVESEEDASTANEILTNPQVNIFRDLAPESEKLAEVQTVSLSNQETNAGEEKVSVSCATIDRAEEDEKMVDSEVDAPINHEILSNPEVNINSSFNDTVTGSMVHKHTNEELDSKAQLLVIQQMKQVPDEKLRQILRKWKQRATKNGDRKTMLANAALSAISIGPPFRHLTSLPRLAHRELNIDHTAREVHEKRGKSWSKINVSEVVAPVLSSKNPDDKCLCWKLLLLVQPSLRNGQANCVTSTWLLSKMMGCSGENDRPIVSVPHLSVWRSWTNSQLNKSCTCCLSTVREVSFDSNDLTCEDDIVIGAGAIMFHVSESIPWEVQRARLHNVLARIPSGARLPLLIVSGDVYNGEITDPSLGISRRLGLHDAARMSSSSVVFLHGSYSNGGSIGYLKDDELRDGLLWLAEHSPRQPSICRLKTRDVVKDYLIAAAEVLENDDAASRLGPNNFIWIFNAALDALAEEIVRAASLNANHWPNPEIDLLEKSSNERTFVETSLPSIGWSSALRIEPVVKAINRCKLPEFSDDLSWLTQGSYMGSEIVDQKSALEKILMKYMSQSCRMLNAELAAREAEIMIRTGASLELRGSYYFVIPRWLMIFRRIQNWRLMSLTSGLGSVAYLSEQHQDGLSAVVHYVQGIAAAAPPNSITMAQEGFQPAVHCSPTPPLLDKIAEISSNIPPAEQSEPSTSSVAVHGGYNAPETENVDKINTEDLKYNNCLSRSGGHRILASPSPKVDDKLAVLLERCTRMQDMIDRRLAIYF